jgi:hypothetical protein
LMTLPGEDAAKNPPIRSACVCRKIARCVALSALAYPSV